jgi:hypothetical protein
MEASSSLEAFSNSSFSSTSAGPKRCSIKIAVAKLHARRGRDRKVLRPVAGFLLAIRDSVEASIWFETHAGADAGEARQPGSFWGSSESTLQLKLTDSLSACQLKQCRLIELVSLQGTENRERLTPKVLLIGHRWIRRLTLSKQDADLIIGEFYVSTALSHH